jgi:thiamine-monophosphate kinase
LSRRRGKPGGEFRRIEWIRRSARRNSPASLLLGIGDDAALWRPRPGACVVLTVDSHVEGAHFHRSLLSLREIGRRAVVASASDLAAMAARPACLLPALVLEGTMDERDFRALHGGIAAAAAELGIPIAGGNLSAGPLSITVTAVGEGDPGKLLRRSGAREGDEIWVTGTPGLARLGLLCLQRGRRGKTGAMEGVVPAGARAAAAAAVRAYRRPRARVEEALFLARRMAARSMIDISDGLAADLGHILEESSRRSGRRLGAALEAAAFSHLPHLPPLARLFALGLHAAALGPSDDYELCFTAPRSASSAAAARAFRRRFGLPLTRLGEVVRSPGLRLRGGPEAGAVAASGWEHFRD